VFRHFDADGHLPCLTGQAGRTSVPRIAASGGRALKRG